MNLVKLIALVILIRLGNVAAAEIWRCDTKDGHRYTSTQNVPSDSCARDIHAELSAERQLADEKEADGPRNFPLFCKDRKNTSCSLVSSDSEMGKIGDVEYTLYRDSASVSSSNNHDTSADRYDTQWMVSCTRDKMTNARSCSINRKDLYAFFSKSGASLVSIGTNHFPGSTSSIKVGQRRFDTRDSDGNFAQSGQIIGLLKGDTPIVTRYMKWPYRSWVDEEFTSYGFQESMQLAKWLLVNGKYD